LQLEGAAGTKIAAGHRNLQKFTAPRKTKEKLWPEPRCAVDGLPTKSEREIERETATVVYINHFAVS
jgi:hypothetical protein